MGCKPRLVAFALYLDSGPEPIHIRSKDEIIARYQGTEKEISGMYMIACKDKYIGEVSVDINHPADGKNSKAWLGLAICEPTYWGTGVAQQALTFIEQIAKDLGAKRMELGTFEFNHRARRFYEKCGYQHIATLAKITHWQNQY
ncbi:MAG: GNAT family N-acetyltransferase [Bdellovibrionota bacterium]